MSAGSEEERLRVAFRSWLEASDPESEVDAERVWRAVNGELPAEERREVALRMATDPATAEAWRIALELRNAVQERAGVVPMQGRTSTRFSSGYLAAAAALVAAVALGLFVRGRLDTPEPVFRGAAVESLVSEGASLPRTGFRLRWSAPVEDARYDLRVTTESLVVLANVTGLRESEYVLAEERLRDVPSGASVLWQVDASLPDGSVVESETFVTRLE